MSIEPPRPPDPVIAPQDSLAHAELASPGQRLLARLIDNLVTLAPFFIWSLDRGYSASTGVRLASFASGLGVSLLNDVWLTTRRGGSIGKLALGTRVVRIEDWQWVTAGTAMRRWAALIILSVIPFGGVFDGLWLLRDPQRQTLHDKAASTTVVHPLRTP